MDLFSVYGMLDVPKAAHIRAQVLTIAEDVLLTKPARLCAQMRKGIPEQHSDCFGSSITVPYLKAQYAKQRPTGRRLAESITTDADTLTGDQETG